MARTRGARNRDYDEKRRELAITLASHLRGARGGLASFNELADSAGVSATTLKHYFGDREGAFDAAVRAVAEAGGDYLLVQVEEALATGSPELACRQFLESTVEAWRLHGFDAVLTGTLAWGLCEPAGGPVFLSGVLEPLVDAAATLLDRLAQDSGEEVEPDELRIQALSMLSPLVLALLHQDSLQGRESHPLDLSRLIDHLSRSAGRFS